MASPSYTKLNQRLDRLTRALESLVLTIGKDATPGKEAETYAKVDALVDGPRRAKAKATQDGVGPDFRGHVVQWLVQRVVAATGMSLSMIAYADYLQWAVTKGQPTMSAKRFGLILNELGYTTWKDGTRTYKLGFKLNSGLGFSDQRWKTA